ncbi:DUF3085 domain-containing protein [Vibrio fluvialis]|uniref:DUF3085 domain-containing protein n=1 Tax=Vibrio fluvialis TaxID=676 RepID=UPI00257315E5|nr:DUF3085 domain-containing protein [Vibrio fluvialis]BEI26562.1 DUF3085 domain-containing protein [Vibrio fluvialis]
MTIAKFNMKDIEKLVAELDKATKFAPTMDDLWNPELHPNNQVVDKKGHTENSPEFSWPDSTKIDRSKIEPKLTMVKDHGLYLITNADLKGTSSSRGTVVYARDCNPSEDEFYYENARDIFGGDDGTVSIPVSWFSSAKKLNKRLFQVELTPNEVRLKL